MKKIEARDHKELKAGNIIVYNGVTDIVTEVWENTFVSASIVATTVEIWEDDKDDENHFNRSSHNAGCFNDDDIFLVFETIAEYINYLQKEVNGITKAYSI